MPPSLPIVRVPRPSSFARADWRAWLALLVACCSLLAAARAGDTRGLPFIRTYPLDEIGNAPRGLRPGFDSFGRFAVMYDGIYSVLNDTTWVNRIDSSAQDRTHMTTIRVVDGKYFYGGRGSWGTVDLTPDGRFRAHSLVSADAPPWTTVTVFTGMLGTAGGVYFYELNGVVYWDFARRKNLFFELPRVSIVFPAGGRTFVSCQDQAVRELLPESESAPPLAVPGLDGTLVERAAPLDATRTLLALNDGRLMVFDGHTATPWAPQAQAGLVGRVSAMIALHEGGIALAVPGEGLFLFRADGSLQWKLSLPEFRQVGALVANEAGVLWAFGENAIHKVFYDSPFTSFGQQLGLTVSWPRIVAWKDRVVVSSNNTLYELVPGAPGAPARFQNLPRQLEGSALTVVANEEHLLASNAAGVFADQDGAFVPVATIENVGSMEFIQPDVCVAIGSREIAALRHDGQRWVECAPRIAGVGDAPIRTLVHGAVWIEMGGDRVGRLSFRDGRLKLERIPLPWSGPQWTNVGAIGSIIVLSGAPGDRTFYDETKEALCDAPELDRLLRRSPFWIARVREDAAGTLWATHNQGVVTFARAGDDYVLDTSTFELRNDFYPMVTVLPGSGVWVNSGRSLYHVERPAGQPASRPPAMLVSLVADRLNHEFQQQTGSPALPPQVAFDDNSLSVRLFSGTYAWRYPPLYEYRLGELEPWTAVDPGLLLRFPKLRDGNYRLEVRPVAPSAPNAHTFTLDFIVRPPTYRTPLAYAAYAIVLLLLIGGIVRWTNQHSLRRNAALEKLVSERTSQLQVAMEKLNEETRNAATLAERTRLAGEIHDSLQQGLSGSILQLDTTMTNTSLSPEAQSRLAVVRGMLSYTREEIQHSIWDLESPLLQNSTLDDALRKLASFIHPGSIALNVVVPTQPISLETAVQHHLLRIAQEAITNAVKHARATRIDVVLESHAGSILLTITDDGTGFDPERTQAEGHFGLRGMRTRAKSIKAELLIRSSPNAGTTVQAMVPSSKFSPA